MTSGMRVSKDGVDVGSARQKDLIFTSEVQSLKISDQFKDSPFEVEVKNLGVGTLQQTVTVFHDLGYIPVLRLFVESPTGSGKWYGDSNSEDNLDTTGHVVWTVIDLNAASFQLIFIYDIPSTLKYKYWIFEDSLDK